MFICRCFESLLTGDTILLLYAPKCNRPPFVPPKITSTYGDKRANGSVVRDKMYVAGVAVTSKRR